MRLLVCGDRDWTDNPYLFSTLDRIHRLFRIDAVVEGGARGADIAARVWADRRGIEVEEYPAEWETFGRAAGPRRNQQMLNSLVVGQDLVVAFHEEFDTSLGTKDMVTRAAHKGVVTRLFPGEGDVWLDELESGAFV